MGGGTTIRLQVEANVQHRGHELILLTAVAPLTTRDPHAGAKFVGPVAHQIGN